MDLGINHLILKVKKKLANTFYSLLGEWDMQKLASFKYKRRFGKDIDWANPRDLNEKINWLQFNSDTSTWTILADKYSVRQFVNEKGYGDCLVKLLGKWDSAKDIDWDVLPNQFVMKVNNGSGDTLICPEKSNIDKEKTIQYFEKMLKRKLGLIRAEPHYLRIKPCIIAEELLNKNKQSVTSTSLVDYKFWCFDGKPECIMVYLNREGDHVDVALFDLEWNPCPEYLVYSNHFRKTEAKIPKPINYDKMVEMVSKLSKGFPQVRIDLYEVDGKIWFGEMTFTSTAGRIHDFTPEFLLYLGSKVRIPKGSTNNGR